MNDKYDRKFTSGTEPSSNFSQPTGTQENEWDYEDEYNPQGDRVPQKNDGVNDKYERKFTSGTEPSSNFSQPTSTQENEWDDESEISGFLRKHDEKDEVQNDISSSSATSLNSDENNSSSPEVIIVDGGPDCNSEGGDEKSSSDSCSTPSHEYLQVRTDTSGNNNTKIVLPALPADKLKETVSPTNSNKSDNSTLSDKSFDTNDEGSAASIRTGGTDEFINDSKRRTRLDNLKKKINYSNTPSRKRSLAEADEGHTKSKRRNNNSASPKTNPDKTNLVPNPVNIPTKPSLVNTVPNPVDISTNLNTNPVDPKTKTPMNDLVLDTVADKTSPPVNRVDKTNPPVNNLVYNTDADKKILLTCLILPKGILHRLFRSNQTTPLLFQEVATAAVVGARRRRNTQQRWQLPQWPILM